MVCCPRVRVILPVVLLAVLFGAVTGQSDLDRFYSRVRCHTCQADFNSEPYRSDHPCLIGDTRENNRDIALCSRNARFCKAEVARQLGLLVTFQRSCAEECNFSCSTKGFGIVRETCTYCCVSDPSCSENPERRRYHYTSPNYTRSTSYYDRFGPRRNRTNLSRGRYTAPAQSSAARVNSMPSGQQQQQQRLLLLLLSSLNYTLAKTFAALLAAMASGYSRSL